MIRLFPKKYLPDFLRYERFDGGDTTFANKLNLGDGTFEQLDTKTADSSYLTSGFADLPEQVQFFAYILDQFPDVNGDNVGEQIDVIEDNNYNWSSFRFADSRYNISGLTSFDKDVCESYMFADVNNDGFLNAIFASQTYLNTAKPDLLIGISGSANYEISYTRVAVNAQNEAPEGTICSKSKMFRWAVQSMTMDGTTYNFSYSNGLHDLFRREFRGFEKVEVNTSSGVTTYSYDLDSRLKLYLQTKRPKLCNLEKMIHEF